MDAQIDLDGKLNRTLDILLNKHKILVLFDNFEDNQYEDGKIIQDHLKDFLTRLIQGLSKDSIAVFTTRYKLEDLPVKEINLSEFPFVDTWKKMNRLENLVKLNTELKHEIHTLIGGQPRSLEFLDSILEQTDANWETIKEKLPLVKKEAYEDLFLDILWENLNSEEQNLVQWISLFRSPVLEKELKKLDEFQPHIQSLTRLQNMSLLFSVDPGSLQTMHYVHRLTAAYVQSSEHMNEKELHKRHNILGTYWKTYYEKSGSLDDLLEARYHYIQGENIREANQAAFEAEFYFRRWGFIDAAMALNEETLNIAIHEKDKSIAMHNIGIIHQARGDYDKALELYQKSMEIKEKLGDISGMASSYGQLGLLNFELERYEQAADYFVRAFLIFHKIGSPNVELIKKYLARVREKIGDEKLQKILENYVKPDKI